MKIMTDGAALLAAIRLSPDDDTVRLAYADWLDEQSGERVPCDECVDGDVGCSACHGAGIYYDPPFSFGVME